MHDHAEGFGNAGQHTRQTAGIGLQYQHFVRFDLLAPANIRGHAHGGNHFGVAQTAIDLAIDLVGLGVGVFQTFGGNNLVQPRQCHHDNARKDGDNPEPGMKQKHDGDVDWKPGGVEKGKQAITGQELPQGGQITKCLTRRIACVQGILECRIKHPAA